MASHDIHYEPKTQTIVFHIISRKNQTSNNYWSIVQTTLANPIKLFSSITMYFYIFAVKLEHFIINNFLYMLQTRKLNSKN